MTTPRIEEKTNKVSEDGECKLCKSGCVACDARFLRTYTLRYNEDEYLELSNIEFLVNDFNFFDLMATYTPADGRTRRGKFHLSELIINDIK